MRGLNILVLFFVVVLLAAGIYKLSVETKNLQKETVDLKNSFRKMKSENDSLVEKIEYYKRPENLLKELKSQFNFVESGEKLIIIVPSATSTKPEVNP